MKLLVTGFEPFGESRINPSEQVVRALARTAFNGVELGTAILPVDRIHGPEALLAAVQELRPEAVVSLGEASGQMGLSVERIAVNLMDYRIPDNAGEKVMDEPIVPAGPAAYFCTLPVRAMYDAIRAAGVPAELSLSAGAYLCNQVLYTLLNHIAVNGLNIRAGFIHLPTLPDQAVDRYPPIPTMGLATMLTGVCAAIGAL